MMKSSPTQIFRKKPRTAAAVVSPSSPNSNDKARRKVFTFSPSSSSRRLGSQTDIASIVEYHTVENGPCLWKALSGRNWTQAIEAVDINPQDAHKRSDEQNEFPLHFAIKSCAPGEVVNSLLRANPTACNKKEETTGRTVLHLAALFDTSLELLKEVLMANPSAMMEKDVHGRIPLHYFVYRNNIKAVQFLLSNGQSGNMSNAVPGITSADNAGHTPLHVAAVYSLEAFRLLSRLCPEALELKTNDGETPYEVARSHGVCQDASSRAPSMRSLSTLSTGEETRELDYNEGEDIAMEEMDDQSVSVRALPGYGARGRVVMYEY